MQSITFKKIYSLACVLLMSTMLFACGGSGGNTAAENSSNVLSGTAATGAAIIGVVNVYGSNGGEILNIQIDASGNYTVDVSGLTAPYYLTAIPDNSNLSTQYSFASTAGTINITPLTTLTIYYANGEQDPEKLVTSWPVTSSAILANVSDAQAIINANFVGLFPSQNIDFTTLDFLTTLFTIGGAFDQILDQISVDIINGTFVVTIAGNPAFAFDSNIDISAINIGGSNNTNGGTVNFGSLSVTGPDSSVVNGTFESASVEVFPSATIPGAGSFMWRAADPGYTVSFGLNADGTVQSVAIGFAINTGAGVDIYHYHGNCTLGAPLADCSTINVDQVNKQIQFNNFSVPVFAPGQAGNVASGPMIINGTLGWE